MIHMPLQLFIHHQDSVLTGLLAVIAVVAELMPVRLQLSCFLQTLLFLPLISLDLDFLKENMSV